MKKKTEVRLWGNKREGRSFCREKERKEIEELESMKRWGRWREWKESQNADLVHISYENWTCRHRSCTSQSGAHILRELNMQAPIPCNTKFIHISYRNWTCRPKTPHKSKCQNADLVHISSRNWTRKYKSHTSQKVRILTLCTYPMRIEYASTNHIQVRVVHISNENWIRRHKSYTS